MMSFWVDLAKRVWPLSIHTFESKMDEVVSIQNDLKKRIRRLAKGVGDPQKLEGVWEKILQQIQTIDQELKAQKNGFDRNQEALQENRKLIGILSGKVQEEQRRQLSLEESEMLEQFEASVQAGGHSEKSLVKTSESGVLSVLIPAYAAERYLGECLASILRSPVPEGLELEVLVGVDGCESTREALDLFVANAPPADTQRIRCLFFPKRCGSYVVQNSLLLASRGETVLIVGADDALAPDALKFLWPFVEQCRACTPDFIVRSLGEACDEHLTPLPGKKPLPLRGSLLFPKSILARLGGFSPWLCAADGDFLRRAEAAGIPIYLPPRVTYFYRRHGVQLTQGGPTSMKSGIRATYWHRTESRVVQGKLRETPIVSDWAGR